MKRWKVLIEINGKFTLLRFARSPGSRQGVFIDYCDNINGLADQLLIYGWILFPVIL
jgi:hypothetical protein